MHIESVIDRKGGLAATFELRRAGVSRTDLSDALAETRIIRVRQGWYARAGIDDELLESARVGGRATCVTALKASGIWVPRRRGLHVAVRRDATQLRSPSDKSRRPGSDDRVRVHWSDDAPWSSRLRVGPLDALRHAASCLPTEDLMMSADSVLFRRPDLRHRWDAVIAGLPRRCRRALASVDGVCESGIETLFWIRMRDRVHLVRQVSISGIGRVDFVIGRRLVVEIDGAEFHSGRDSFERDRRRDAALTARGYRVLRFSYRQVTEEWPSVEAAVLAAVSRGDHL